MTEKHKSKGFVVVMVAILLIVLIGFGALAIDLGWLLTARTAAQRAADAGALAGAFTFVANPSAVQPTTALDHARSVTLSNKILEEDIAAGDVTVQVDLPNRRVTVDITHSENIFFARVFGLTSENVRVRAVAEASRNAVGSYCTKPWFITNTIMSSLGVCGVSTACTSNQVLILPNGEVNTTFVNSKLGVQFRVKPGNPADALNPGEFYCIRLGDSTGGNDYRTNISTCSPNIVSCQKLYGVEPGNMIGPTKQGVQDLRGPTPDTWVSVGQYRRTDGTIGDTSRQLIIAPIWDICSMGGYCDSHGRFQLPDHGANITIRVIGFALLFLDGVQGNDVLARLIGVFSCGLAPAVEDDVTGPYSIPVRLVRVPST